MQFKISSFLLFTGILYRLTKQLRNTYTDDNNNNLIR